MYVCQSCFRNRHKGKSIHDVPVTIEQMRNRFSLVVNLKVYSRSSKENEFII